MADRALTPEVTIVPANEASWEDLQAVFGSRFDTDRHYAEAEVNEPDVLGSGALLGTSGLRACP
jgi:hypothetical protein